MLGWMHFQSIRRSGASFCPKGLSGSTTASICILEFWLFRITALTNKKKIYQKIGNPDLETVFKCSNQSNQITQAPNNALSKYMNSIHEHMHTNYKHLCLCVCIDICVSKYACMHPHIHAQIHRYIHMYKHIHNIHLHVIMHLSKAAGKCKAKDISILVSHYQHEH